MVKIILNEKLCTNNLISEADIEKNSTLDEKYEQEFKFDKNELKQLINFINIFISRSLRESAFESFYFGYKIPKIRCGDFDFLKINKDNIVNIEFKDISSAKEDCFDRIKEKLLCQLQQRERLLSVLKRKVVLIGYILDKNHNYFYRLEEDKLIDIDEMEVLSDLTSSETDFSISNLSDVLNRELLNISPINFESNFMEGGYELTDQQDSAIRKIKKLNSNFYIVKGEAGTGKSLVAFELAKIFSEEGKKTILFFVGLEEKLYEKYNSAPFKVLTLSQYGEDVDNRFEKVYKEDFNVLIIDEAQRLGIKQINRIKRLIEEESDRHCIFVFDSEQNTISDKEGEDIKKYIEKFVDSDSISRLSLPLRFDNNMRTFIRSLFGMRNVGEGDNKYANVEIVKVSSVNEANEYSSYLSENDEFIKLSPLNLETPLKGYKHDYDAHKVFGKDFDNIVIAFNDSYSFNEFNGIQRNENNSYSGRYDLKKCYYELLTRVKNKIVILVIDNDELYDDLRRLQKS
jgi:hypothetical protein